jgi:UDPglucose 6-dehydrogenase
MNKIGVVGLGYVGGAITSAYESKNMLDKLETYDINENTNRTCTSLNELLDLVDIIYVCVPTPMTENGECDVSILESVIADIAYLASNKIIVIKSTVTPGTTERMQTLYTNNIILFSPEFLTEANFKNDYMNQDIMLLGVPKNINVEDISFVMDEQLSAVNYVKTAKIVDATVAEFYKYTANTFLATKVSFSNEMASIAKGVDVDWNDIVDILLEDKRMGQTHWKVPGPDGRYGFGGTCFPKDLAAIIRFANQYDIQSPLLKTVWNRNVLVDRPEKDWEQLKGRAVRD